MKQCKCERCSSFEYSIVNSSTVKDERYGVIRVEMRECSGCAHRYRVAIHSDKIETYYR